MFFIILFILREYVWELLNNFQVMHAQYFGAVGAILYNDPADYAPFGTTPDKVYDQKWYMPPSGAQRGATFPSNGDPLTPIYPSTGLTLFE